jgi:hypothetical protein
MKNHYFRLCCLIPVLLFSIFGKADNLALLQQYEDSLRMLAPKVFHSKTDELRKAANEHYLVLLQEALQLENSFEYPFDSLIDIGKLKAPDASFRIYQWNIPQSNGTQAYFGFIQRLNPVTKKMDLFRLNDKSAEIKNPESQSLDYKKWYGALYYKIIKNKSGKNVYYTLLGWDGHSNQTWKKLIEVLWFDKDGSPKFGESLFVNGKQIPKKRIVFEFRAEMIMALKYDEAKQMIIFDNLAPESPEGKGIYEDYVMDGSYNAYAFHKGKWHFVPEVDALNPKRPIDKFYQDPKADPEKKTTNILPESKKKKKPEVKPEGQK